jgi:hypothetical protein
MSFYEVSVTQFIFYFNCSWIIILHTHNFFQKYCFQVKNPLSVFFKNIKFYLEICNLQFATTNIPQQITDITLNIKDIFVSKFLIRMEFVLYFMWKINKEISVSECSLNRIICYVYRTVSNLTLLIKFFYERSPIFGTKHMKQMLITKLGLNTRKSQCLV